MNLLKFEMKKVIKQKKYIWILIIVFLITSAVFWINSFQRSRLQTRWPMYQALREFAPLGGEWANQETLLIRKRSESGLTPIEEKQLEYSREIGRNLQWINISIRLGEWDQIPMHEQSFLNSLQKYHEYGGEFPALDGLDRDIAIAKNTWMVANNIPYEIEMNPITQHLFLKQTASILLGVLGLAILLVFFGNSITEEKEQNTYLTLQTQPISTLQLVYSKYLTFLAMALLFFVMIVGVGLLVPLIREGQNLNLNYPQILTQGDSFLIISTSELILRNLALFMCAASVTYSISLLASKWATKSLSSYFLVGIFIAAGYLLTSQIKSPINPFYLLNFNDILVKLPGSSDWLYVLSAIGWSGLLLILTVHLPDMKTKTGQHVKSTKPFSKGNIKNRRNIWALGVFEWRKIAREGLLISFIIGMLVITVGGHFILSHLTNQKELDYIAELEYRLTESPERAVQYEELLEDVHKEYEAFLNYSKQEDWTHFRFVGYYESQIEHYEKRIVSEEIYAEKLEAAILGYQQGHWIPFYEYQLFINEMALENTYGEDNHFRAPETIRRFTKETSIVEKYLLMERDIRPVFSGEFIPTIHQHWGNRTRVGWRGEQVQREQWESENTKLDDSGLFYLYLSFKHNLYLLPLALILFFIGGGIAKEKGKRPTLNLLKTQPISEQSIFTGKILSGFSIAVIGALLIPLMVVGVGSILSRIGDWNYPILHYNSYRVTISPEYTRLNAGGHGYHFITLGRYLMNSVVLFASLTLFVVAVSNVFSLIFKRSLGVLSATVITLAFGYWSNGKKYLQMSDNSPFTYFDIPKVINGEIGARLNNPTINVYTGTKILLGLTVLLMAICYIVVNRTKMYNWYIERITRLTKNQSKQSIDK